MSVEKKRGAPSGASRCYVVKGMGFLLGSGGLAAAVGDVCHGACHIDSGESADDYTEEHCEGEAADSVATENEEVMIVRLRVVLIDLFTVVKKSCFG